MKCKDTLSQLKLIPPELIREDQLTPYLMELENSGEVFAPISLDRESDTFEEYIDLLVKESRGECLPKGYVPASTLFLVDEEGYVYGAVNIRHRLTENLRIGGGHVGYGIRPCKRRQGYGTRILQLALLKMRDMGIADVLVTCDKNNIGSAAVIRNNGGVLDSEVEQSNKIVQRYWIKNR